VTAISLLSIHVDSAPKQVSLDPDGLLLRLEVGVSLDLSDASPETCRTIARLLMQAARVKTTKHLTAVS
jgi:hypothetical protein